MTANSHAAPRGDLPREPDAGAVKTILVPLDGSATAEAVLPHVEAAAMRLRPRLILLAVHQPGQPSRGAIGIPHVDQRVDEEARAAMGRYLHDVAERLRDRFPVIDMVVLQGDPSDRIATYAASSRVDLLAIASHGRGGVSRVWLGSVTDRLIRHVEVPMLVVHARASGRVAAAPVMHRALVPLDGTREAEAIFGPVTRLLAGLEVEYTLMQAVVLPNPLTRAIATRDEVQYELAMLREHAIEYLAGAVERFRPLAPNVSTMVATGGDPAREILEAIESTHADLLAMTTHGKGSLGRALIGSVADKAMRGAPVPVLLQRVAHVDAPRDTGTLHSDGMTGRS